MKNLTISFLTLILIASVNNFNAQIPIFVVDTSNPSTCDGAVYYTDSTQNATLIWNINDSLIEQTNAVHNLCPGHYTVEVIINGITSGYSFSIGSNSQVPCDNFYATVSTTNLNHEGDCDDWAYAIAVGGISPYSFLWSNGDTEVQADSLCYESYSLIASDSQGCSFTVNFTVGNNDTINNNLSLSASVQAGTTSTDGACDASAFVEVQGGTAPYTFLHDNGQTSQVVTGLCSGIHSVYISDSDNDTLVIPYLIVNPSEIIFGENYFNYADSTLIDFLNHNLIQDCALDFPIVDSAFISNITYISNDSIQVNWTVLDANNNLTLFTQFYQITGGIGVYELLLQIYCPQRIEGNYLYIKDKFYFNPSMAFVNKTENIKLEIYPNPFNEILFIESEEEVQISIFDISGKVVLTYITNGTKSLLNTSKLEKGNYFVKISTDKINFTKNIIK